MKPLYIPPTGDYLYHSTRENTVDVWSLSAGNCLATCPGSLVGTSMDGRVLLTSTPAGAKAWQADSGQELDLASLDPLQFEFHQRVSAVPNRFKLCLELHDMLGLLEPRMVLIDHDQRYYPNIDTWELTPDNKSLVATLSGEVAGEDWASGICIDLESGQRRYKFKVNKFQTAPPINFSPVHSLLLVSDDIYHLAVLDMETGRSEREVWVSGFTNVATAFAVNPWLVAVNVWEPTISSAVSPFSVQILNLERVMGGRIRRAVVEAVLAEPQAVVDLLCAPDGIHLASLLANGAIHWWDLATLKVAQIFEYDVS